MELKFVFKIFPVLFIYIDKMPKFLSHRNGISFGPIVIMLRSISKMKTHQVRKLTKSKQIYKSLFFHKLLYKLFPEYRLECALEVYQADIEMYSHRKQMCECLKSAEVIRRKYHLYEYTNEEVQERLLAKFGIPYINSSVNRHNI